MGTAARSTTTCSTRRVPFGGGGGDLCGRRGNDHVDASTVIPAAYPEVITVSALADSDGKPGSAAAAVLPSGEEDDTLASFSNFGPAVDLIARGVHPVDHADPGHGLG